MHYSLRHRSRRYLFQRLFSPFRFPYSGFIEVSTNTMVHIANQFHLFEEVIDDGIDRIGEALLDQCGYEGDYAYDPRPGNMLLINPVCFSGLLSARYPPSIPPQVPPCSSPRTIFAAYSSEGMLIQSIPVCAYAGERQGALISVVLESASPYPKPSLKTTRIG